MIKKRGPFNAVDSSRDDIFLFSDLFNFKPHSLVNFVGGGGKTLLIHVLMQESIRLGHVLYTTTARMHPPSPDRDMVVLSCSSLPLLKDLAEQAAKGCAGRKLKIVATGKLVEPDLLAGIPRDFLESFDRSLFHLFLNEADGCARFSLKLPRNGEPVPMEGAEYLVPVIGLDCLGRTADSETIFRFQNLSSRFSLRQGEVITPELAAKILMHPEGVCKDWKEGMEIIPYINKVDDPELDGDAKTLASSILGNGTFPVNRIVWGSVRYCRGISFPQS